MRRFKKTRGVGTTDKKEAGGQSLPDGFADALERWREKGSVCAVSRVARDRHGNVSHVEWGITTPSLYDWVVGPAIATAHDVALALGHGVSVVTLFATGSGFACGPNLVLDERGQLAISEGHSPELNVWMLARLNMPPTLN
jgi:hypothetical protein